MLDNLKEDECLSFCSWKERMKGRFGKSIVGGWLLLLREMHVEGRNVGSNLEEVNSVVGG